MDLRQHHHVDWRALFARRGFRFFFLGIFVSLFGSGMNFAGVTWYILGKTNSTVQVSFMLILWMLPGLIVPFAGGILIDRLDRRHLGIAVVPRRLMGRTQSAFAVFSTTLQVVISFSLGWVAEKVSLPFAFFILAALYGGSVLAALRARALAATALPTPAVER